MNRPHSAKPARNYFASNNEGHIVMEEQIKQFKKIGKRQMLNALSASNDLSRMLPKKIIQDKERLYCETLQLKSNLNDISEENLRLKTKVATLQKEKDRLQQCYQSGGHRKNSNAISLSAKNQVNIWRQQKQNAIVSNLKKMIREAREQNQKLNDQITKLKRAIRYTKINEVQVQKQAMLQENKRLAKFVQSLRKELEVRVRQDEQVTTLQHEINVKIRQLKEATSDNIRYEEILEELQMKNREISQRLMLQQKKSQRDISIEKHKIEQLNKQIDLLKFQVKSLKEKAEEEKKNTAPKKIVRPSSNRAHAGAKNNRQKQQALKINEKLRQQVQAAKQQLVQYQTKLKKTKQNTDMQLQLQTKNQPFSLVLTNNELNQFMQSHDDQNKGHEQAQKKSNINELPIQQRPSFKVNKAQQRDRHTAIINEIKQLLTLRMKYNRYPFQQLKSDIEASPLTSFSFEDLIQMLMAEPFYLTKHYAEQFLKNCYSKYKLKIGDELPTKKLLQSLRQAIGDFQFLEDQQEERELYKLAQIMTRNRSQLQSRLHEKSRDNCVSKDDLADALTKYAHLSRDQIELAICYVSINIETLNAINYAQFLDRFYIKNSQQLQGNIYNQSNLAKSQEFSMGQNEDISEGELIEDNELV